MAQRRSCGAEPCGGRGAGTGGHGRAQMPLLRVFKSTVMINLPRRLPPGVAFLLNAV